MFLSIATSNVGVQFVSMWDCSHIFPIFNAVLQWIWRYYQGDHGKSTRNQQNQLCADNVLESDHHLQRNAKGKRIHLCVEELTSIHRSKGKKFAEVLLNVFDIYLGDMVSFDARNWQNDLHCHSDWTPSKIARQSFPFIVLEFYLPCKIIAMPWTIHQHHHHAYYSWRFWTNSPINCWSKTKKWCKFWSIQLLKTITQTQKFINFFQICIIKLEDWTFWIAAFRLAYHQVALKTGNRCWITAIHWCMVKQIRRRSHRNEHTQNDERNRMQMKTMTMKMKIPTLKPNSEANWPDQNRHRYLKEKLLN